MVIQSDWRCLLAVILLLLVGCENKNPDSTASKRPQSDPATQDRSTRPRPQVHLPNTGQGNSGGGSHDDGDGSGGIGTANAGVPNRFVDFTQQAGIQFAYSNGRSAQEFAIIESLGGGVALFDVDLDGNLDVMFAGGGRLDNQQVSSRPSSLYRNLGGGQLVGLHDGS